MIINLCILCMYVFLAQCPISFISSSNDWISVPCQEFLFTPFICFSIGLCTQHRLVTLHPIISASSVNQLSLQKTNSDMSVPYWMFSPLSRNAICTFSNKMSAPKFFVRRGGHKPVMSSIFNTLNVLEHSWVTGQRPLITAFTTALTAVCVTSVVFFPRASLLTTTWQHLGRLCLIYRWAAVATVRVYAVFESETLIFNISYKFVSCFAFL